MEGVKGDIQKHEDIMIEFKAMWAQLQKDRSEVEANQLRLIHGRHDNGMDGGHSPRGNKSKGKAKKKK